jgi:hypothetical protein
METNGYLKSHNYTVNALVTPTEWLNLYISFGFNEKKEMNLSSIVILQGMTIILTENKKWQQAYWANHNVERDRPKIVDLTLRKRSNQQKN